MVNCTINLCPFVGKQMLISPSVDCLYLYPTLEMCNISLEANFGNDPEKPFAYDVTKCPGMSYDWNWTEKFEILTVKKTVTSICTGDLIWPKAFHPIHVELSFGRKQFGVPLPQTPTKFGHHLRTPHQLLTLLPTSAIPVPTFLPFPSINPFRKTFAHISNSPLTIEGPIHPTQFKLRHFIPILECNFFYAARCIACRFESPTSFLINLLYGNFERAWSKKRATWAILRIKQWF
jgi:hypothetical protein